jgi:hypothetical protein
MPGIVLLWLVVLVALAIVAVIALRRTAELAAGPRELDRYRAEVASIEARLTALVVPLVRRLDDLRRLSGDPVSVAEEIGPAMATLQTLSAVARSLQGPPQLAGTTRMIIAELERATRAADLVDHGLRTLLGGRDSYRQEAQVSLKRGTLNLRHARDAVARLSSSIAALTPADLRTMPVPMLEELPPLAGSSMPGASDDADGTVIGPSM